MSARERLAAARLYAILDFGYADEDRAVETTEQLLAGGADLLQLRAKKLAPDRIQELARRVQPVCARHGVPLIINDFPEIAVAVGAAGVHIGQDDGSLEAVRATVGPDLIVGRSTHAVDQAAEAVAEGFDYIGFGPLFPTPTKQGRPGIGLAQIAEAERVAGCRIPMFCIGGIKQENLPEVLAAGARRAVIVSGLLLAEEVAAATRQARDLLPG